MFQRLFASVFFRPEESKDPAVKKAKTEWTAALKKLKGDTSFCKDWLQYQEAVLQTK